MQKNILLLIFIFSVLISCKKKKATLPDTPIITPQLYSYTIKPSVTNNAITVFDNEHYVYYDTRVTSKNKVLIFLPGTTGAPNNYSNLLKAAAGMGYHTVGLMYPNNSDMYAASAIGTDLSNFGKCRQEIFDGTDQTTGVNVDNNNCIKTRLIKLLQYLYIQHPEQNWNQYLVGNADVKWSSVVLAGHSQGGGHAFYIAKKLAVDRTIAFASIDWNTTLSQSAAWVAQPGATTIDKFYSYNHIGDEIFAYSNVQTQLGIMGLTGPAINADNTTAPYANSHTLTSTVTPAIPLFGNHSATCLDVYLPKDAAGNINPNIVKAWDYLLGK
jgi:hypothetical protein